MGFTNAFGVPNLKFGVVTNVSTVATPYDGQVVYETDNDRIMCYNGTTWLPEVSAGTINAKGDLLVGTADNTVARLAVGANGTVLTADSGETGGMKWGGVLGLEFISSTTIGSAVSSVTVSNAFSSTYDNYKIIVSGGAASGNSYLKLTLGATTTGYYFAGFYTNLNWASGLNAYAEANAAAWYGGTANVDELFADISIFMPNLAKKTTYAVNYSDARTGAETSQYAGFVNNTTQYTAFTLTTAAGTMTGGTVKVYGYRN